MAVTASESSEVQRWLPIESNPEVMNSFLKKLGVSEEWGITDVYGLDEELLAFLPQPVLGLLLLFPINEKYKEFCKEIEGTKENDVVSKNVYYMKQTISNACGTVALMHSVANNLDVIKLADGPLKAFLDETADKTPDERAVKLEEDDAICQSHDDAAREGDTEAPAREDSVDYHFVAFIQVDGHLYELDGRKSGPIIKQSSSKESFLKDAAGACKEYMARDPDNHQFSILALAKTME